MAEFALDLDPDAIRLLRRSGQGWDRLGEVRLDAPDLDTRLKALQARASALSDGPLKTELVIPATQILHLEFEMGEAFEELGTGEAADAVAAMVRDRTSSASGEVAFDWMSQGRLVRAAVASAETLGEAQAFADAYGFNPVRARAWPDGEAFPEEADLGPLLPIQAAPEPAPPVAPETRDAVVARPSRPAKAPPPPRRPADPFAAGPLAAPRPASRVPKALLLAGALAGMVAVGSAVTLTLLGDEEAAEIAAAPPPEPEPSRAPATSQPPEPRPFTPEPVVVPVPDSGTPAPAAATPEPAAEPETAPEEEPPAAEPSEGDRERARYAATGIWRSPPAPLPVPEAHEAAAPPLPDAEDRVATVQPAPLVPPTGPDRPPAAMPPPPPPGTAFAVGPDGRVDPAPEGAPTPDGITLYTGLPPTRPPARPPETILSPGSVHQDPALAGLRPRPRPDDAPAEVEPAEPPALPSEPEGTAIADVRPGSDDGAPAPTPPPAAATDLATDAAVEAPEVAVEQAVADALSGGAGPPLSLLPTAPDEADAPSPRAIDDAVAASLFRAAETTLPLTIAGATSVVEDTASAFARSLRPLPRPDDPPAPRVRQAAAPVTTAPAAEPQIPTRASVARRATLDNVLALNRLSLVGVFGAEGARRALIRLPSGRFEKVKVGDRLDGGRVRAIEDGRVIYVRGSRAVALEMPGG